MHGLGESPNSQAIALEAYRWFVGKDGFVGIVLNCYVNFPKLHTAVLSGLCSLQNLLFNA